jgi:hydrogenase maturation protein HypF
MAKTGRHIEIRGTVQGVGFRPRVYQLALRDGVAGRVRNDSRGVIIDAFGTDEALDAFTHDIAEELPPAAQIRALDCTPIPYEEVATFSIVASARAETRNVSIPPDLATCDDCLHELFDPNDRRHLYPFINCTNCGPRFTIVRDAPYDRDKTTMARFALCDACKAEYDDPTNRRFHAQPNACPACGPQLTALDPKGHAVSTNDPLQFAARTLRAQMIVALKSLGGFHLACDATSGTAVRRLRNRKRRDAKPFAVMVRDLAAAEELAVLTDAERALLVSPERPIVLVRKREGAIIASEVAPDNPLLGLFLPSTPLHHILLRTCGMPLVMTSGNASDEPMATQNAEALERLNEIADLFLMHDRDIETRADDSIVRVIANAPTILRRARGYVPRAIHTTHTFEEPVLAVGAQQKNTICLAYGNTALLGPHNGNLDTELSTIAFEQSIEQLIRFAGERPKIVAHDLHPDYASTRWATQSPHPSSLIPVPVQHHHAHAAAAMLEHGLTRAVAVTYDGTGYGTDGTSWGGEILIADLIGYERFATFRPIALAGCDRAVQQVWRIALALLDDAFEGAPPLHRLALFRNTEGRAVDAVRRMIERDVNAPKARGIGRYFDALGSIALAMPDARYEGEVAMHWNLIADPRERRRYELVIRDGVTPWEIDPRPMIKSAVVDLVCGVAPSTVSAKFHNTLAAVTIEVARAASAAMLPIVLTGGCFQNALLTERILDGLPNALTHQQVPPNDGGIALGQAAIASAITRQVTDNKSTAQERSVCA